MPGHLKARLQLLRRNDIIEIRASHSLDVHTHSLATSPVVTLLFGNAEAEVVLATFVGRNPHLEDAETVCAFPCDFVVVVSVLDAFESLLLAELDIVDNRTVELNRQGILETEFELAVRFDKRRFRRFDQVTLLRNVLIGDVVFASLAHSADFAHVGIGIKVDIAADRGEVGRYFEVFAVFGGRTRATD